jgi:hypothetical protein
MINKILSEIQIISEKLKGIKFCGKCNNGILLESKKIFNVDMNFKIFCDCQYVVYYNQTFSKAELEIFQDKLQDKIRWIKRYIPGDYWYNVYFENQDKKVKAFKNNDKIFLWVWSKENGSGKTSILYSWIMNQIMNDELYFYEVINECNFGFKTMVGKKIFLDDVMKIKIPERIKYLINYYYNLINFKRENRQKIIFTSNFNITDFISEISKYDKDIASAIYDRMHNVTDVLHLQNNNFRGKIHDFMKKANNNC